MPDFESGAFNRALPPLRLLTSFFSIYFCLGLFGRLYFRFSGRRFSHHPTPARNQAIDRRGLVFRSEMCVPHDHLERPMPEQFRNRPQIHPGHNESTGKGVAVAMPGIFLNLGLFEGGREPSARPLEGIACAHGREDGGQLPDGFAHLAKLGVRPWRPHSEE